MEKAPKIFIFVGDPPTLVPPNQTSSLRPWWCRKAFGQRAGKWVFTWVNSNSTPVGYLGSTDIKKYCEELPSFWAPNFMKFPGFYGARTISQLVHFSTYQPTNKFLKFSRYSQKFKYDVISEIVIHGCLWFEQSLIGTSRCTLGG